MKTLEGNNYCRCSRCHSFLQYAPTDIVTNKSTYLFGLVKEKRDIVYCPVCKTEVEL